MKQNRITSARHSSNTVVSSRFYDYDERGVRAFVRYSEGTGKWAIECWRKKTPEELKDEFERLKIPIDSNWKMKREGHIMSYKSRQGAEQKALELAEDVCTEFGF